MQHPLRPMIPGRLLKRYKRFLADIRLPQGEIIVAHCANSGSMATCADPDSPVMLSVSDDPKRKLRYTWELIEAQGVWVGVNTATPNAAVTHFVRTGQVPELAGYTHLRREVKYGSESSRIDLLLTHQDGHTCHVEVKNATMRVGHHAAFPDAVTLRGQKHLRELTALARRGERAVMFYYVGRADCLRLRPADEIDPAYGALLRQAASAGVEILAYRVSYDPYGVALLGRAPVDLV